MKNSIYFMMAISIFVSSIAYSQTIGGSASAGGSIGSSPGSTGGAMTSSTGTTGTVNADSTSRAMTSSTGGSTSTSNGMNAGVNGSSTGPGIVDSSKGANMRGSSSIFNNTTNSTTGSSTVNTTGSFGIVSSNSAIPDGSSVISRGEIISINHNDHTARIRETGTGTVTTRSFDDQMLTGLNEGDSVQIYSQSN